MTKRSMPIPMPAVGGIPLSRAVRKSSSTPHASSSPIAFLSAYMVVVRVVRRRIVMVVRVVEKVMLVEIVRMVMVEIIKVRMTRITRMRITKDVDEG